MTVELRDGSEARADLVQSGTYPIVSPSSEPPRSGVQTSFGPLLDGEAISSERRGPGTYDRKKTPEQRWAEQRHKLLLASAHVFARDGFASASVAAILERSGLSRGTFYRHFHDLGDAFATVRAEASRMLFEVVEGVVRAESDPPAMLRAGITTFLRLVAEHGDLARVFLREGRTDGAARTVTVRQEAIERFVALIQNGLGVARERGLLARLPSETTVYALVVAIEGVAIRYLEAHQEERAVEAAPELLDICFRCFK
jgi:AcrR family transcriptional regulator